MPYDLYTPFGVRPGQVSDEDRINASTASDNAARLAAQAEIAARLGIAHESNLTQRYGIDKQLEGTGTYGQRAAQDSTMFDKKSVLDRQLEDMKTQRELGNTDRLMNPQNTYARLAEKQFNSEQPLNDYINGQIMALSKAGDGSSASSAGPAASAPAQPKGKYDGMMGTGSGPSPAPSGAPGGMNHDDLMATYMAFHNHMNPPNFAAQRDQAAQNALTLQMKQRDAHQQEVQDALDSGDVQGAQAKADKYNVALKIPPVEEYLAKNEELSKPLAGMTQKFAAKDTDVFGWDPTDNNVQQILDERDRLKKVLLTKGYKPDVALREATRVVMMNLGDKQNDLNNGMIQRLKAALTNGQIPQSQEQPSAFGDSGNGNGPMM